MESLQDTISDIRKELYTRTTYITAIVPLKAPQSTLFYSTDEVSGKVDFSKATAADLEQLAKACQPATFGLNQEPNVRDESYHVVKQKLVQKDDDPKIRFELYKLNVYGQEDKPSAGIFAHRSATGPGFFFKSHVDTPRGQSMFGSLVVVLPTLHARGSLLFRHNAQEWAFDSAAAISVDSCTATFTAFFSDVEHGVAPILSGYRVTITYNLYFATPIDPTHVAQTTETTAKIHSTTRLREQIDELLKISFFLPDGG